MAGPCSCFTHEPADPTSTPAVDEWAERLSGFFNPVSAVLTFANPVSPWTAHKSAGTWVRKMERETTPHLQYAAVVEPHPHVHVHGILGGVGRFATTSIQRTWRRGSVWVDETPNRIQLRYVATKIVREELILIPSNPGHRSRRLARNAELGRRHQNQS